ncbi:MAG: lipocalin-like domain-containing protein [Verrucomicrobia bacterium]|nr:lipocalin-like domain-containing protein [Verrucomicrobiota bacterium]
MQPLRESLPGTWQLISREDRDRSGRIVDEPSLGRDPVALLYYDRTGHFAAQFMKRDRRGPSVDPVAAGPNNSRAQDGYDAYFGTYEINDRDGTITQRLLGALSRENIGLVVTRAMAVEGDTLTIRLETTGANREPVTRTLIWHRVG